MSQEPQAAMAARREKLAAMGCSGLEPSAS